MMDRLTISAVEPFAHSGYPLDAEAILLCESDGTPEEVQAEIEEMRALLESMGATQVEVSQNEAQRLRFWSGRKASFPAAGRISPDYYCIDGTIPRRSIAPVLARIAEFGKEFGLRCMNVFHAGDGNLHPLILFDANCPGDVEKTEAFGARILELCIEVGGTITGEHGVGVEKLGGMCGQFTSAELEWFHAIKHAFDAAGLLNPGKAVPSLHRCAEMGRMYVHRGQLPHPELPRF
jgi:glycolate oxidase